MDDGGDYAILDTEGYIIAEVIHVVGHGVFRPSEANARAIAKVPEMVDLIGALARLDQALNASASAKYFADQARALLRDILGA